jgi:ABC-type branched-subunit amino acid transport system substrate-binding protein
MRILLLRPESDDPSPIDQSLGVRSWAARSRATGADIVLTEEKFRRGDNAEVESKLAQRRYEVSAVIGATNVPESTRLGELAAKLNLLCFVANNNPLVWQGRKQVFHIGLPTRQTTAAVAALIAKTDRHSILLLHDRTEFQSRVATSMEDALRTHARAARCQAVPVEDGVQMPAGWKPDLIYLIFSSEARALRIVQTIRNTDAAVPLLFGRSLLRESFLTSLGNHPGECWFVDMFHRDGDRTSVVEEFFNGMAANGVKVPTANHAFGWDCAAHCAAGLNAAPDDLSGAVAYLESGVTLAGASGMCRFGPENHNGRFAPGPHTVTRWHSGRLEEL